MLQLIVYVLNLTAIFIISRVELMDLNKPKKLFTAEEINRHINDLANAKEYGDPRQVWVEDGHVFVEGHDGEIVSMTPAVAIKMGRMLGEAGAASLINQVMDESAKPAE